jgi:hypothetical protein
MLKQWITDVQKVIDKINIEKEHYILVNDYVRLVSTFKTLYTHIFLNRLIVDKLSGDLNKSINNLTNERNSRLSSHTTIKQLLYAELLYHHNNIQKCKHRTKSVIMHILWLNRTIWLLTMCIENILKRKKYAFQSAYQNTIQQYHNILTRAGFKSCFALVGNGTDVYNELSDDNKVHLSNIIIRLTSIQIHVHTILYNMNADFKDKY